MNFKEWYKSIKANHDYEPNSGDGWDSCKQEVLNILKKNKTIHHCDEMDITFFDEKIEEEIKKL